ncbi:hypothetical protein QE152_g7431 [Popillia japonica]|uniref:Uncharacterized protein n=1 Tax=Popillia japonica TaxID=7064 RepID=A0AAW1MFC1_POPJA
MNLRLITMVMLVFPAVLATNNNCNVLFLHSSSVTFDFVMYELEVDGKSLKKAVLPDAVFTIPNCTFKIDISSTTYKVGLVVIPMLTNLPDSVRIVRGVCGDGIIGVVSLDSPRNYWTATKTEIENLAESGCNIIIAVTPNNNVLTEELIGAKQVHAIVQNAGKIWTKSGELELVQNEENDPKTLFVSFDKYGDIIQFEDSSVYFDESRIKRQINDTDDTDNTNNTTTEQYETRTTRTTRTIRQRSSMRWRANVVLPGRFSSPATCTLRHFKDCDEGECALGNFIADAIAFYARWHIATRANALWAISSRMLSPSTLDGTGPTIINCGPVIRAESLLILAALQKQWESKNIVHIAGLQIWKTADNKDGFASARKQILSDPSFDAVKKGQYSVTGSKQFLKKFCAPKCEKACIRDIVQEYVEVNKDIIPQIKFRYWDLTRAELKLVKDGYGKAFLKSGAFTTFSVSLKLYLSLCSLYVV